MTRRRTTTIVAEATTAPAVEAVLEEPGADVTRKDLQQLYGAAVAAMRELVTAVTGSRARLLLTMAAADYAKAVLGDAGAVPARRTLRGEPYLHDLLSDEARAEILAGHGDSIAARSSRAAARLAQIHAQDAARRAEDKQIARRTTEIFNEWVAEAEKQANGRAVARGSLVAALRAAETQATREVRGAAKPSGQVW